jgi:hypothetical protein
MADSLRAQARTAGLWYLLLAVVAPLSAVYVPSRIVVAGDATATARNIVTHPSLYRAGIVGSLASNVVMLCVVASLYTLLHAVDRRLARLMVILVVSGVAIAYVVTFHQIAPLVLLSGADFLQAIPRPQLDALAYGFLRIARTGGALATAFWGLWLFPLGALVIRSGFLPRLLGLLLVVNGAAYVAVCLTGLAAPAYLGIVDRIAMPYYMIGELATIGWLVVKGAAARPASA